MINLDNTNELLAQVGNSFLIDCAFPVINPSKMTSWSHGRICLISIKKYLHLL